MGQHGIRIHRMEESDFQKVREFIQAAEAMLERGNFALKSPYEEWQDWDDDDPEKIKILAIRKSISKYEDVSEEDIDGRIIAYEYLRVKYTGRLTLVLMENVCDYSKDYLDFHPTLQQVHVAPEQ